VFLRLPVLASDAAHQRTLIAALNEAGIGATGSYPNGLADVPELAGILLGASTEGSGGRDIATRIVTLPTHPYVSARDMDRMVDVVQQVSRGRTVLAQH
jgi:dTDP-4-amino-4,6-dideoxygalactose transaminase